MPSDIRKAREIIEEVADDLPMDYNRQQLFKALNLMFRDTPDKIVRDGSGKRLTKAQVKKARRLRALGWSKDRIARYFRTIGGRVTEALKRKTNVQSR